ncbi:hypothetical protein SBA5_1150006 [Candidatus Sulfotelmatomonas gaucii]|uniref:Uncharacterized protein n=1 Tax=Candidatus Sulfuritelmatomonas gaucii TaxID=2043161 RepID=A0A2N9L3Q7_9BACT|nr:hypothetical protein SBA5_1150006 [Candidatus Sulfotelmatomonas gaucii]
MMAVWWTNTSSPLARLRKPNPFASLNHFTVPCSITVPLVRDVSLNSSGIDCELSGKQNRQEHQIGFDDQPLVYHLLGQFLGWGGIPAHGSLSRQGSLQIHQATGDLGWQLGEEPE